MMTFHILRLVTMILVVGMVKLDDHAADALSMMNVLCNRRDYLSNAAAAAMATTSSIWLPPLGIANAADAAIEKLPSLLPIAYEPSVTRPQAGRSFFPTLTPPFFQRATVRYNLECSSNDRGDGNNRMWAFEQLLTFVNVTATIRCTVVRLSNDEDLWVHSPQWPTGEFCALLDELPGTVRHVVLPCNALEHKAPMSAFLSRYPDASVWIAPGQYGPFGECGRIYEGSKTSRTMNYRVDGVLSQDSPRPPWADEFDMATLYIDLPENAGPVTEVAFCHRPTKTLIATDAVVYIPSQLPNPYIFETYFGAEAVRDPYFWPKTVLQSVFLPLRFDNTKSVSGYPGFDAIADRLVRAPILRGFNDARGRDETVQWIDQIAQWDFNRIVTSHFVSPISASPQDFRNAFQYLAADFNDLYADRLPPITCQDWSLLDGLNDVIAKYKLGAPASFDYKRGCK
jgi:hypothetical protein